MADEINIQDLIDAIQKGTKSNRQAQRELSQQAKTLENYKKLNAELVKQITGGKEYKKLSTDQKKIVDQLNDAYEVQYKELEKQAKITKDINTVGQKLIGNLFDLGNASVTGKNEIKFVTESFRSLPLIGAAIADVGKSLDFNIERFRALASVGADFGQSMVGMRIASRDAMLPLMEFVDLVAENSSQLAGLYGSVNQGAIALSGLTRGVRANLIPEFAGLGITTENLNDYLSTFFEQQRIQNRQEYQDTDTATKAIRSYTTEVDKIAKLTGVQRDQINGAIKAQRDDSVFQSYLRGLTTEQANQQQALVAGLSGLNPAVGDAVKNILATGFPLGEFESMLVGTTDGLLDNILALRNGEIGTVEFTNRLAASSKQFANTFDPAVLRAGGIIGEVGNNLLALNRNFADQQELTAQQEKNLQGFTAQIGQTQEQLRRLGSQFEGLNTTVMAELGPGLGLILRGTNFGLNYINEGINFLSRQAPMLVASAVIAGQVGKYIFDYASQIAIVAAGTTIGVRTGLFGLRGTLGMLGVTMASTSRLLTMLMGGVAGLTAAANVLSGAAKALNPETRGEGIGQGIGAVAGYYTGKAGGALIGQRIGQTAGMFGGPIGALIGTIAGTYIGGQIGSLFDSRDVGTIGATGLPSEPSDIITKVQKGERVLTPKETEAYNNGMSSSQLGALLEANQQMVKSLNTLVGISAKTEKNTETSTRRLANFGNLV